MNCFAKNASSCYKFVLFSYKKKFIIEKSKNKKMINFFFKGKNYLSGVLLQDRLQFIENEHTKSACFLRHDLILVGRR